MVFASSGAAALAELESEAADVVVTDMQMPGMDGAALLSCVREPSPETIRIILTVYAGAQSVARAATATHRLLAKLPLAHPVDNAARLRSTQPAEQL